MGGGYCFPQGRDHASSSRICDERHLRERRSARLYLDLDATFSGGTMLTLARFSRRGAIAAACTMPGLETALESYVPR